MNFISCVQGFHACVKNGFTNICAFFNNEHTPLENGLLVTAALLGGIIVGMCASPVKSFQVGSGNGCANTITDTCKKGGKR